MGKEMREDFPVLPPDDWGADEGGAYRAPAAAVPPGGASHLADGFRKSRDSCLRVHVTGSYLLTLF